MNPASFGIAIGAYRFWCWRGTYIRTSVTRCQVAHSSIEDDRDGTAGILIGMVVSERTAHPLCERTESFATADRAACSILWPSAALFLNGCRNRHQEQRPVRNIDRDWDFGAAREAILQTRETKPCAVPQC